MVSYAIYIFIGLLVTMLISITSIYLYDKYMVAKIKTVSITDVLENKEENLEILNNNKMSKDEYVKFLKNKMSLVSTAIKEITNKNDVVLLEEFVVDSNSNAVINITNDVKKYVKKHSIYINK